MGGIICIEKNYEQLTILMHTRRPEVHSMPGVELEAKWHTLETNGKMTSARKRRLGRREGRQPDTFTTGALLSFQGGYCQRGKLGGKGPARGLGILLVAGSTAARGGENKEKGESDQAPGTRGCSGQHVCGRETSPY